ncbi:hypothetical protein CCACVL1_12255 [Corchorus capsularis]|uniref:CCHC-type domain-containing protein n=1 Tax=Corchorus capsularis TaxID=210143 RepID=A0A1R3IGN9_COCAP|nr:hypothetical protein CCACVL1_12255 [Corchorus capsularis]
MVRALEEGPWTVMGHCLLIKKWQQGLTVTEMEFRMLKFWVQVHNLPIEMLTHKNALVIGSELGRIVRIEEPITDGGLGRSFLRIRIEIDVDNHLVCGFWVPRKNLDKVWANIKYERLADFCYGCGKIGHVVKHCSNYIGDVEETFNDIHKFVPHMRTTQARGVHWSDLRGERE